MALPRVGADLPGNLSRQAVSDLVEILRYSARTFGPVVARRSRERLLACLVSIERGHAMGHRREDVRPRRPTVFLNEDPWVICFNPNTRHVYRILHAARDFPAVFRLPSEGGSD